MTTPRAEQIDLSVTSYYHCITRCVRRAFLCGKDKKTGQDFSARKEWIVARIKQLAKLFAIKTVSYAVMSNHYHMVVCVNDNEANTWTDEEVKLRWSKLFWRNAQKADAPFLTEKEVNEKIVLWRKRLMDISWFMRCLNEHIAREANKEDKVTGRFWEGRFKCQALLDEGAILTAMAYVDLNPIRANLADTPEESTFTSIHERIKWVEKSVKNRTTQSRDTEQALEDAINQAPQPPLLMPFDNGIQHSDEKNSIDFLLSDYLVLIDETGRILRDDKPGAIPESLSPILERLKFKPQNWLDMLKGFERKFAYAIGNTFHLTHISTEKKKKRSIKGYGFAKQCYQTLAVKI